MTDETNDQVSDPRAELPKALRACTPKQRRWLRAIPENDFQAWTAAKSLGFSSNSVHKWMRDPRVKRVRELLDLIGIDDLDITTRRIKQQYARLAYSNMKAFYREDGSLKQPHEWDADMAAAVVEYSFDVNGKPKIKLNEKRGSNDALAKMKGLLKDSVEHSGSVATTPPVFQFVRHDFSDPNNRSSG